MGWWLKNITMSVLHYFSNNPNKRAKFIFNFIAPIYKIADKALVKNYQKTIDILDNELSIKNKTVLDIGTGTGAWATTYKIKNAKNITGVDFADKMLNISKQKHPEIHFEKADAENLINFKDNSFDIVTASYVLHGVKQERRKTILKEMQRVSAQYIVLHDFVGKTPIFIRFLEFMEKSDYKFFKQNICNELNSIFSSTKKIKIDKGSGLYICYK